MIFEEKLFPHSPFRLRLWAWAKERFPLVNIFASFLLVALIGSFLEKTIWASLWFVSGLGIYLIFLLLRVLDEHKDFYDDSVNYPHRVLQRGLVHLSHLKILGLFAFTAVLALTFLKGNTITIISWFVMMIWALLMTYEFFCHQWLKSKLFLYSLSHMLILPLMVFWAGSLLKKDILSFTELPFLLLLIFFHGLTYEVIRKVKGKEEELEKELSFSKTWGVKKSSFVISCLLTISLALSYVLISNSLNHSILAYTTIGLAFLLNQITTLKYRKKPCSQSRKANEGANALYSLLTYLTLIIGFSGFFNHF